MQKLELGKLLSGLSKITEYIRRVSRANTLQLVGDESLRQAKKLIEHFQTGHVGQSMR